MYEYHRRDEAKVAGNMLTVCKGGMEEAEVLVIGSLFIRLGWKQQKCL